MAVYDKENQEENNLLPENEKGSTSYNPAQDSESFDRITKQNFTPKELKKLDEEAGKMDGDDARGLKSTSKEKKSLESLDNDLFNPGSISEKAKTKVNGRFSLKSKGGRKKLSYLLGAAAPVILFIIFLANFGSLKIVNFAEILTTTGYARLHSVLNERNAQNIFDAALMEGEGSIATRGTTMRDRLHFVRPESDLAELGRSGKLKFIFENDTNWTGRTTSSMKGIRINGDAIMLDSISQKNFGANYNDLGVIKDFRKRMTVRAEFVDTVKTGMNDLLETDSRYVRSRAFTTISDNIGFKFSRWNQAARNFIGKTPEEAVVQNFLDEVDQVVGEESVKSGLSVIDENVDNAKARSNLKAFLEQTGRAEDVEYGRALSELYLKADSTGKAILEVTNKVNVTLLLASLACMTRAAVNKIDDVQRANAKALAAQGLQLSAAGSQIKYSDVTAEAINPYAVQLNGGERAPAYEVATTGGFSGTTVGDTVSIPSIRPEYPLSFLNFVSSVLNPPLIPSSMVDDACSAILNPYGAIAFTVLSVAVSALAGFLSGGGSVVAEEGGALAATKIAGEALKEAAIGTVKGILSKQSVAMFVGIGGYQAGLNVLTRQFAGAMAASGTEKGADYIERAAIGNNIVENQSMRTSIYGRPLTEDEYVAVNDDAQQYALAKYKTGSLSNRLFSVTSPYSIAGKLVANLPIGASQEISKIGSVISSSLSMSNIFGTVSNFASLSNTKVKAQAAKNYNYFKLTKQWGYSEAELEKMRSDPAFSILENADYVEPQIASLDAKYSKCFTDIDLINTDNNLTNSDCSATVLGTDEALHYRLYKGLDNYLVGNAENGVVDAVVNHNIVAPGAAAPVQAATTQVDSNITYKSSNNTPCPIDPNISEGVVVDAIHNGVTYQIKLCNLMVNGKKHQLNVDYVAQFNNMFKAFNSAGYLLNSGDTGDGYRSSQQQANSYARNPGNFAPPGSSNHEYAVAIDIQCSGNGAPYIYGGKASKDNDAIEIAYFNSQLALYPCLNWLHQNSASYGFLLQCDARNSNGSVVGGGKDRICEPWHISPNGH